MEEKILKKIERQLKKIEDHKNIIEVYDINTIRDCYIKLNDYKNMILRYGTKDIIFNNINDEIKISNNIIKRYL